MKSALSIAIAALLVTSLLAMTIVAASPVSQAPDADHGASIDESAFQQERDDGTTTRLGLDGPTEYTYAESSPDLGATLAIEEDELRNEWALYEAEHRWETLSDSERAEILERLEDRLQERITQLETRESEVTAAVRHGDARATVLLRTQVRNDREAKVIGEHYQQLSDLADQVPDYSITVRPTLSELEAHEGPIRDRVFETIIASGQNDGSDVFLVEASESGSVVSAVDERMYLREATRLDHRDTSLPNQLGDRDALLERMDEIYPWAHGDGFTGERSVNEHYSTQLFRAETVHNHGTLRFYLDGGTAEVFREIQALRIDELPTEPAGTWANDSIELSINETPRNGPIEVTATDVETGEPIDGEVTIGDTSVARTGQDGSVWVAPPSTGYDLTVHIDDRSVTADGLG